MKIFPRSIRVHKCFCCYYVYRLVQLSELYGDELNIYGIWGDGHLVVEKGVVPFATCVRIRKQAHIHFFR